MSVEKLANQKQFPVHVVIQRLGDFVLVPPLCTHQVINKVIFVINILAAFPFLFLFSFFSFTISVPFEDRFYLSFFFEYCPTPRMGNLSK